MKSEEAANYWNAMQEAKKPERLYLASAKYSMVVEALATLERCGVIDAAENLRLRQKFLDAYPGLEDALNKLVHGGP